MEEELFGTRLNSGVDVVAGGSDSNSNHNPSLLNMRPREDITESSPRFKGVLLQQNGRWGAQIYANHHRIWLGTFGTEKEAAMAYDSAAIKVRRGDAHRNFPWIDLTILETNFQDLPTAEAILLMIRDGSYQSKLIDFVRSQSMVTAGNEARIRLNDRRILFHQLFHKELTPSDVGKLNRIVIPKKHAMTFFPLVPDMNEEGAEDMGKVEAMEMTLLDRQLKLWKFRYCYWKSSQSFVFTKGWNRFVKEKGLKANDVITFYRCEYREELGDQRVFYMIDVCHKDGETNGDFADGMMEQKLDGLEGERKKEEKKGFKLFGVQIN